ncbi:phosphoribosylaminoimidazolesuccinocarboxamide synthase [Thermodesulforhabdus norvegica]|uniref:Phosphoribosylaminoimidazole-succinocarboxamide synthase n=1 Tax=Thermodesulforhabdus norvegica TaxID=39841 RepID=A0A1I4TC89_9BACT|nr:phosphoribosylaminoimidazolesuccinocarboxamide synthase [Thermodesulforhabdus norvegica]SFM74233.1 phosphoribosylaminoimidazole-succinocarboxamide synthase [Thermodesulforhabdus norvegica]
MGKAVYETNIEGLKLLGRGKVRDIYDLGDRLLIVATDRISAFDVVMPDPIPDKGRILTMLSLFWLDYLRDVCPNHLISAEVRDFPHQCREYEDLLRGRTMLVKKARVFPVECIVRGYIIGSGWKDYQKNGTVCGITLPKGLKLAEKLPEPIFTPSTKAEQGLHDENITFDEMVNIVGKDIAERLRDLSIELYKRASDYAEKRGIIIADTKFEFGLVDGEITLVDEVLTPDSSRFWPKDTYRVGTNPESFDKQYVRDFLIGSGWKPGEPAPHFPEEVIENTRRRYLEALVRLSGKGLDDR